MAGTIVRIDAFEAILPLPKPLRLGAMVIPHREYSFVRIYDEDGRVGTGFALSRNAPVADTALRCIAPHWNGRSLDDADDIYAKAIAANRALGTNGIFWRALSLADCALYDLLAQRAGKPLAEYLGGTLRQTPTMMVGGYPSPDESAETLAAEMRRMLAFDPVAVKIGSSSDYARDTERLTACRAALPADKPLMIDLYWATPSAEALLPHAQQWSALNMGWIEDPFVFDDFDNVRKLADNINFPVAVGDEESGERHFERLMDLGHIRVVRLDATACGGIRTFQRIAAMAAERNIPVSCHVYHHVHTQLASVVPNVRWVEYFLPTAGLDSIDRVWNADLEWRNGGLVPASAPGMGYDWNEAALAACRRKGST